ncbi:histidine phosphatase family protein [Mycobacterium sp. MYCO198283]|uniref:histidine phosphatase family protein n=1 Tax=Mycobacterium sp. MYCO198283 TaxID=2883505 RepID=UPI001E52328D|nr:histidine phosphatase family protein [Mycobacterium sp. MYCO198283]MCG5433001.1 histidine phosphatase family protein [Mycobacterium sp. MYCO198283]
MSGRLVLLRHGQSLSNVERRLDTRPPGAELTPLGREQAGQFAASHPLRIGMLLHSEAVRAAQTAEEIARVARLGKQRVEGIHEVQVGDLELRNDDEAITTFNDVYARWHAGDLGLALPGGESAADVLDRYLPVLTELRLRYLDDDAWTDDIVVVSHGAAIRLAGAVLSGVDGTFAVEHHLANTEAVVLAPVTDGRWSCVQWGAHTPPFLPDPAGMPPAAELGGDDPMG